MAKSFSYFCISFLTSCFLVWGSLAAAGNSQEVTIYLFSVKGCIHCLEEKKFLAELQKKSSSLKVVEIELTEKKENQEVFEKVASLLRVEAAAVPFTVIGNIPIVGWHNAALTGTAIEQAVQEVRRRNLPDITAPLLQQASPPAPAHRPQVPETVTVPLYGAVEIKHLSLGFATVILGALDGFNPCAMWALIFLIGLLLNMQNRRRMWALGGLFIGGSGLVYFLFMAAWLNILLFLGLIFWIRVAIGAIALAAAVVNLREYFLNKSASCTLLGGEKRQGLIVRIRNAIEQQSFFLAAGGIFLLGVAVNLVELFCSAGLPVVYTQILTLSRLPVWQYYGYIALYIVVFMLDDLIVFVVSMLTLQHFGLGVRYQRFSNLLGGVVLLLVGLLLIFKPQVLMFG